jgi:hypothetical protein
MPEALAADPAIQLPAAGAGLVEAEALPASASGWTDRDRLVLGLDHVVLLGLEIDPVTASSHQSLLIRRIPCDLVGIQQLAKWDASTTQPQASIDPHGRWIRGTHIAFGTGVSLWITFLTGSKVWPFRSGYQTIVSRQTRK